MKVVLICLGVLSILVTLVLYACVVVGARCDEQNEQWREQQEQQPNSDQNGEE